MADQETWMNRINALLRKAESTTPEEADLLLAKANELMVKYAIDQAMLAAAHDNANIQDEIIVEEIAVAGIWQYALGMLNFQVLRNSGIKCVLLKDVPRVIDGKSYKKAYVLKAVGYKSDIERAKMLIVSLHIQALRAENAWWRVNELNYTYLTKAQQHIERRGFLFGFAQGVGDKLRESTAKGRRIAEQEHGKDSVALVLVSREQRVSDKFDDMFPSLRKASNRMNQGGYEAYGTGRIKGKDSDVGQPGLRNKRAIGR